MSRGSAGTPAVYEQEAIGPIKADVQQRKPLACNREETERACTAMQPELSIQNRLWPFVRMPPLCCGDQ